MFSPARSVRHRRAASLVAMAVLALVAPRSARRRADRAQMLDAMKRATTFMVEKVAYKGGYVWSYLPDLSRRWGEMEARADDDLDPAAGHAVDGAPLPRRVSRDRRRVLLPRRRAGRRRADAARSIRPAAGTTSPTSPAKRRCASGTTPSARTRWRLEEFQHYYGNATFDDAGTAESAKFFLRLYVEKQDPKYKARARQGDHSSSSTASIRSACGRSGFRAATAASLHGLPDYTGYATFNDDVAAENMDFLLMCYQALGDARAARSDRPRHERVPRHAAGAAAAGLGAAAHARPAAGRRAHLRAEGARHAHDRRATSSC